MDALSRADVAWLRMEAPTNHFVVTSLMLLDEPLELGRLRDAMARRLPVLPRLGQRVVDAGLPGWPPRWEPDSSFELDAHLHRVALPGRGGRDGLEEVIGDLAGQPIDLERPPWQAYLVEEYEGRSAVIVRLHHCIGDGAALVQMLQALTDPAPDGRRAPRTPGSEATSRGSGAAETARRVGRALLGMLGRPGDSARAGVEMAGTLARLALLDPDPPTALRPEPGVLKRAAWSDPLSLESARSIAHATGTTVNDVLVSAVSGGLRAYLRQRGGASRLPTIRAMVPVDMRPHVGPATPGNRFSLVLLELPMGAHRPLERLMRVKIEMDRIKASSEAAVGWGLVRALGILTPALERPAAEFFARKATLVLTNVVGPAERRYLAGASIESQAFWEPESGSLGLGVSILSYAERITLGVIADARAVPRPRELIAAMERSFVELARAVC